jgi:hypothetical protein
MVEHYPHTGRIILSDGSSAVFRLGEVGMPFEPVSFKLVGMELLL